MSLKFYIGEENIPKDKKFINDVESFFMLQCRLEDNEATRRVMKIIDKAEYMDTARFTDRFGTALYKECLSTGAKIVLAVMQFPDIVFRGSELGDNAYMLLAELKEGNVFFSRYPSFLYTWEDSDAVDIEVDGIRFESAEQLCEYLEDRQ